MPEQRTRRDVNASLSHNISYTSPPLRIYGRGIVFQLPASITDTSPLRLLQQLDSQASRYRGEAAYAELRRRLHAHAATMPLPPAALAMDEPLPGDETCEDLTSVLCVLSRTSGNVYLRDREPNLALISPGRRLVLLIPPTWRPL